MANIELLDAGLARIDANPEEWNQTTWGRWTECGTVACLFGHIAMVAGGELVFAEEFADAFSVETPEGYVSEIQDWVIDLLDITQEQAVALSDADNTREDLQGMRDALARNPDATLFVPDYEPYEGECGCAVGAWCTTHG